ncbi:L,D-transpeptidase [Hansschlegelia zhihuaiae]|uniref:L,D-transpeptidase n=1 Tax=Hansschlegelia zhihuaiae TaxID=405005 RepID=A0A4Q0M5H8_9HYPH|nr:L,D-transpeptidase [Hansschlegelia zhihuaiae]RXF68247.1 L,D-transpeptidase [Hansschlegelia zhihuaiae]
MVRASAAAFFCAVLGLSSAALAPAPAAADPVVIPAPDYVPRGRVVRPAQAYGDEEVRVVRPERRTYGRAYVDDIFEDDDGYYERRSRRIPTYRERARSYDSDYDAVVPRRAYGRDYSARRYQEDGEYGYESIDPDVERLPRRLAGPPSTLGAGEGRRTMDPKFARTTVRYNGSEPANSIVIDTRTRYLYLVQGDGTAIRYGVGVGKEGFTWKGVQKISAKREWPDWHPPAEMRERRPELPVMMAGGPDNPLGARALYLGNTLYRIHGSNEPWTIGRAVSSGCIRMTNEDVIDLYERVNIGTTVKVL